MPNLKKLSEFVFLRSAFKDAKAIQIDHNPKRIGLRYPVDIGLTGNVQASLKALLPK